MAALAKHGEEEKVEVIVPQMHKEVTENVQVTETPPTQIIQPKIDEQPNESIRPASKVS